MTTDICDRLKRAYQQWRTVYEAVHGTLTPDDAQLAADVAGFLITCAAADHVTAPTPPSNARHGGAPC